MRRLGGIQQTKKVLFSCVTDRWVMQGDADRGMMMPQLAKGDSAPPPLFILLPPQTVSSQSITRAWQRRKRKRDKEEERERHLF